MSKYVLDENGFYPLLVESPMITDAYKITMSASYYLNSDLNRSNAVYHFVDRNHTVYPKGFDVQLRHQIELLETLRFTDDDIEFLMNKMTYVPKPYFTYFLKNFRFKKEWVEVEQDAEGHLEIWIGRNGGYTFELTHVEVTLLYLVSRLYYIMTGLDEKFNAEDYYFKSYLKAEKLLNEGLTVSDFGTRRAFSLEAEDIVIQAFMDAEKHLKETSAVFGVEEYKGKFAGTSNLYLAKKYNITPIGTMAHEYVSLMSSLYGPAVANKMAMEQWNQTYKGNLGIFLYDTYTFDVFAKDFNLLAAQQFKGLRVDSGNNEGQLEKIIDLYTRLGENPRTKQVVFSNAFTTDTAIENHRMVNGRVKDSYGIGTHLTNDVDGVPPMNIVVKLVAARVDDKHNWCRTCKMSEDVGKTTGDIDVVLAYKTILGLHPTQNEIKRYIESISVK